MINHHPPLELLFDYATGSLPEPVALVIASHASLCGHCRDQVRSVENVGGALLDSIDPVDISDGALKSVLARLDEPEVAATRRPAASDPETADVVPEPLLPYLGRGLAHLAWRGVGRMFEEASLPLTVKGFKASLMRLKPGAEMPVHTHRGVEYTLVLAGGYKDGGEQFIRGDLDCKDPTHEHRPVVDTGEPCLCLVVLDAPVKLTSAMGRLVNPFLQRWFGAALMGLVAWMQAPNLSWSALESCGSGKVERDPLSLYGDEMVFSVLRDGDPIGIHRVTFDVDGDRLLVGSRFEARVKVLFITAFEYLYESQSVWRDGCLVELKAITDDNGEKSRVSARLANGQLVIEGPSGAMRGKAGLFPTDHWHSGVLQSDRVLNTITGRVARVDIADMGEAQIMVNDAPESARRYVYSGDLQTEVWYDWEGRWVKMRFRAEDGSTIEYICRKCRRAGPRHPA